MVSILIGNRPIDISILRNGLKSVNFECRIVLFFYDLLIRVGPIWFEQVRVNLIKFMSVWNSSSSSSFFVKFKSNSNFRYFPSVYFRLSIFGFSLGVRRIWLICLRAVAGSGKIQYYLQLYLTLRMLSQSLLAMVKIRLREFFRIVFGE